MFRQLWNLLKEIYYDERGGTGSSIATDDFITAAKMNLKLESVAASELDSGVANSITFHVNAFICPAPGTDWTPQLEGVGLAQNLTSKKCWLPLNFLKVGDIITTYNLVGDAVESSALTLDCKLVRINKANPLTTSDIANGAIAQVTVDGNFDVTANNDDETVATDKQYVLEILGTTTGSDVITVIGAEITITRILKP